MQENLGRSGARTTSRFGINVGFSFSLSLFFSNNGRRSPLANREHEPKPAPEATPSTSAGGGCDDGQAACSRRAVEVDGVASLEHAVELCQEARKRACCTEDEGGPFGVVLQEKAPNCHELLQSKAAVVNVMVKRRDLRLRHVRIGETNASEPLETYRKCKDDIETRA